MPRYSDRGTIGPEDRPDWPPNAPTGPVRHARPIAPRKRVWLRLLLALGVLLLLLFACAVATSGGVQDGYGAARTEGPVSIPGGAEPGAVPAPPPNPDNSSGVAEDGPGASGPLTEFGDGNWEIGVDIAPGKYKSAGPALDYEGAACFAQTTKEGNGEIGDIAKQEVVNGPITFIIPAKGVKFFESTGCQTWKKVG